MWAHSDGDGDFDVMHTDCPDGLIHDSIKAHANQPGHGKLMWDNDLLPYAYASNTAEPFVYQFDMSKNEQTAAYEFSSNVNDTTYCPGTHGMAYSNVNGKHNVHAK